MLICAYTHVYFQVVRLFQAVGVENLEQVRKESIEGSILVELNEDVLQKELGIRKHIHRIKLMKIIDGSVPVTHYIKLEDYDPMGVLC